MSRLLLLIAVFVAAGPGRARAQTLGAESHKLFQVAQFARYDHEADGADAARAGVAVRLLAGRRVAYCAGADLAVGATSDGVLYNAELLVVGLGLRLGGAGLVAVCGGGGIGGVTGGGERAALQVPVELRGRGQLGPVRVLGWLRARFAPLSDAREREFDGAVALGWGRQRSYWPGTSAGAGPYVAVHMTRVAGRNVFGVSVGLELLGAN